MRMDQVISLGAPRSTEMSDKLDGLRIRARFFGANLASLKTREGEEAFRLWLSEAAYITLASIKRLQYSTSTPLQDVVKTIHDSIDDFVLMRLSGWSPTEVAQYLMELRGETVPAEVIENVKRGSFRARAMAGRVRWRSPSGR